MSHTVTRSLLGDHRLLESTNLRSLGLTQGTTDPESRQTSRSRRTRLKEKTACQREASAHREVHTSALLGNKS